MAVSPLRPSKTAVFLNPGQVDLTDTFKEVTQQINWVLDTELQFEAHDPLIGNWDPRWIKELVWLLAESLLPLADPPGSGSLRARKINGWTQVEFQIPGNPLGSEELSDLADHCNGKRSSGRHLFRRDLHENFKQLRFILQAHQGSLSLTSSQSGGTQFVITLPSD